MLVNPNNSNRLQNIRLIKIFVESKIYSRFLESPKPTLQTKPTGTIFLDLATEFCSLCHKKLLDKLHQLGFYGKIHDLLRRYLSKHSQRVRLITDTWEGGINSVYPNKETIILHFVKLRKKEHRHLKNG